jgi:arylsulfatase A-like enzyme
VACSLASFRRDWLLPLRWLSLVLLLAFTAAGPAATAPEKTPPNFVFILVDDMGWADGECFGSQFYRTPNLNRLAAEGMRFTSAYAACAVCSPTRAALMTGKAPARLHITDWIAGEGTPQQSRFRVPDWQKHLPLEEVTLAEALKPLGYVSASVGKWHLGGTNFFPQQQGFDVNVAGGDIGHPASFFWPYGKEGATHRVPGLAERGGKTNDYLTDQLTDEAIKFITANRAKPFFLYLPHYAVHSPLMGKAEIIEQFGERPGANGQSNRVYAAMLQSVDDGVGRILKTLAELQLGGRTVVVFTSDNGGAVHFGKPPATSNAPLRSGKGFAYEGGLRVPLLVKAPGVTRAGSVSDVPVITQDWFPTLLALAGADAAASRTVLDGVNLVPLLQGQSRLPRDELFWHYPHYWNGTNVSPFSVARVGDWKLIRFYESDREELYDLRMDLSEKNDLAAQRPEQRQELSARLDRWLKEVGAQMPLPKR